MNRIRCPHCGAVNQDVTPEESCWQCGKPLSEPATPTQASGDSEGTGETAPVQPLRQMPAKPSLEERVAVRKAERAAQRRRTNVVPLIAIAILIIILLIVFLAVKSR